MQSHIIVQELKHCILSLEVLINLQAVSAARVTVFSCAGNFLLDRETKQPIYGENAGKEARHRTSAQT